MALAGVRVIEFAGLAPVPFAGMILADWGADVVRIDRPGAADVPAADVLTRGKRSIVLDVRSPQGIEVAKNLISRADVLLDPYRPGVLEKLGLGPDVFLGDEGSNHRLVYARLAGFEPTGPQRDFAGHDLNYLAASGVLHLMPQLADGTPSFPLNILADFAGGGQLCATGVLLALIERERSGKGQVVSTDMVSGTRYMSSFALAHAQNPYSSLWLAGKSMLGGDAPFYRTYECKDGGFMSVACLEPKFFAAFLQIFKRNLPHAFLSNSGSEYPGVDVQADVDAWPQLRQYLNDGFRTRTRDDWARIFSATDAKDACVFPVLSPSEAASRRDEQVPSPHPRLSRTPAPTPSGGFATLKAGLHTTNVLSEIGYGKDRIAQLVERGVVRAAGTGSKL